MPVALVAPLDVAVDAVLRDVLNITALPGGLKSCKGLWKSPHLCHSLHCSWKVALFLAVDAGIVAPIAPAASDPVPVSSAE